MLKKPREYEKYTSLEKYTDILAKFPLLRYWMSVLLFDWALVDESGMIRTQMGMHNRSEMVAVQGSPCLPAQ
jgi:hypothetical protein